MAKKVEVKVEVKKEIKKQDVLIKKLESHLLGIDKLEIETKEDILSFLKSL